jgi:glycosyltransferase involved in cell wall biosynthesis
MDKIINLEFPKISIVIPIYNVEKFIERCFDSIFNQHFLENFEVIAIDDASTDNSLTILRNYKKKEKRLKIIEHRINKKVSIARSTGIEASIGDYIMFVDSDDCLLPNTLAEIYKKCLESDADIVVFNYITENINGKKKYISNIKKEIVTTSKEQVQYLFYGTPWNKIVKRKLLSNMIVSKISLNMTEDLLYATEILLKANKICLYPRFCYKYIVNSESLTWNINPIQLLEIQVIVLKNIKKITVSYNANSIITNNILKYLEKYIYISISRATFLQKKDTQNLDLLNSFQKFPEMSKKRIESLALAMRNKYYALFQVLMRFGLKQVIGILMRTLRQKSLI